MIAKLGKPLSFYTKRSAFIHLIFFVIAILVSKKLWLNSEKLKRENISLVKSSVRVDVVAMPKMTLKELKTLNKQMAAPAKAEGQQEEIKETAKVVESAETSKVEFEKAKKKQNFMDMLKNLSKKKVDKVDKAKPAKKAGKGTGKIVNADLNKLIIEGNKISQGSSIVGDGESGTAEALGNYLIILRDKVKGYWKLPSYLLNKDFRCRVRVFIAQSGKLLKAEIYESSGNEDYDTRALAAVKYSAPFPPVEEEIAAKVGRGEILLGFPL